MALVAAVSFLTVLRLPWQPDPGAFRTAPAFFPLVGALVGIAMAVLDEVVRLVLPMTVSSALVLLALLGITGGLHLDGLADTCDGFFAVGATPERRLEIMRDSHVGAYAIAGVVLVLLVQYAALSSLSPAIRVQALILMGALSRWGMAAAIVLFPYGRTQGLGTAFHGGLSIVWPAVIALTVALVVVGPLGVVLLAAAGVLVWITGKVLMSRLPGLTGDSYGAINEVTQAFTLVGTVALWP
jgi:adenosylcobinamide-GDP ribazoletransferase